MHSTEVSQPHMKKARRRLRYPTKLFLVGFSTLVPWVLMTLLNAMMGPFSGIIWTCLIVYSLLLSGYGLQRLHQLTYEPFHYCSNIISSLRQGDFSIRSHRSNQNDALGVLYNELNLLTDDLRENRLHKMEENRRFQILIDRLEVAVISIDDTKRLVLANDEAAKWLGLPRSRMLGAELHELGLGQLTDSIGEDTLELKLAKRNSRFLLHSASYRENGRPCRLFVLTDLKNPLREEERRAWKSLIRVISHEVNNSITPISSLAGSLRSRIEQASVLPEEERERLSEALQIISNRSSNMTRFIKDCAQMAKLPLPQLKPLSVQRLLESVVLLGWPVNVRLVLSEDRSMNGDEAQLQQLLINLVRNAVDAVPPDDPKITIAWSLHPQRIEIRVSDNGPGLAETENLFVPFFTTKKTGSGIGLALCREIAENHRGSLELLNRPEGGCQAILTLPLMTPRIVSN